MSKTPGPVGIVSHSGSLTNILGVMASQKGILFSKVISSGNECDLSVADFLTYLGHDSETGLVGAYIEGIQDGARFFEALRDTSRKKPVIVWKVGLTPEGSRAANSHTGALAGSRKIWQAVVHQSGAIPVVGFEAWVDALMGFALLPEPAVRGWSSYPVRAGRRYQPRKQRVKLLRKNYRQKHDAHEQHINGWISRPAVVEAEPAIVNAGKEVHHTARQREKQYLSKARVVIKSM